VSVAEVLLWGKSIGAVSWTGDAQQGSAQFEYSPGFLRSGLDPAPIYMPTRAGVYEFQQLPRRTFKGLPGMLADALPDRWGNALIDQWLHKRGLNPSDFDPVARLSYLGKRAMGALEFKPAIGPTGSTAKKLSVDALVTLAAEVLRQRGALRTQFGDAMTDGTPLDELIRVGTSAGGARAKAVIAWNPSTSEVRSGQADAPPGFSHWLIKFDDVGNNDREGADPPGLGAVEYTYFLLARALGVEMSECRLHDTPGRRHFMTQRFDRKETTGEKLHAQTLAAVAHMGIDEVGIYGYEDLFRVMQRLLKNDMHANEQMVRRVAFNLVGRNQDDHCKNFGFLMAQSGHWRLSPAYDLGFAFDPVGRWTSQHQLQLNGKRDDFSRQDFATLDRVAGIPNGRALRILDEVIAGFAGWPKIAHACEVPAALALHIAKLHRLHFNRR
jgi:serine/threonine-protein kinase HipA